MTRALVLTGFGINCEEEMAAAWRLAGASARIVHLNALLSGRERLSEWDVISFPGGFSFGDDLGSGRILANRIRHRALPGGGTLLSELRAFVADGGFVIGVCNGFQVLVKLGLLPDLSGEATPEATLTTNASGHFEDRWVRCVAGPAQTPFLDGIGEIALPVRHGEGRLVARDPALRAALAAGKGVCLRYCDDQGQPTMAYPQNPAGSDLCAAGLCDPTGRIFGLMPHPEAYLSAQNHPDWAGRARREGGLHEPGEGLRVFQNLVRHLQSTKERPR